MIALYDVHGVRLVTFRCWAKHVMRVTNHPTPQAPLDAALKIGVDISLFDALAKNGEHASSAKDLAAATGVNYDVVRTCPGNTQFLWLGSTYNPQDVLPSIWDQCMSLKKLAKIYMCLPISQGLWLSRIERPSLTICKANQLFNRDHYC